MEHLDTIEEISSEDASQKSSGKKYTDSLEDGSGDLAMPVSRVTLLYAGQSSSALSRTKLLADDRYGWLVRKELIASGKITLPETIRKGPSKIPIRNKTIQKIVMPETRTVSSSALLHKAPSKGPGFSPAFALPHSSSHQQSININSKSMPNIVYERTKKIYRERVTRTAAGTTVTVYQVGQQDNKGIRRKKPQRP